MNTGNYFNKIASALMILIVASFSFAQNTKQAAPRQEKLLNNLKILMWQDAATDKATVKLRIHSGAAFDTLGKEGTMALLADALFPTQAIREFFAEDLEGSLSIESNYDYIQINATGKADQILTILETVAAAVTKPTLDKDVTAQVKTVRLAKVKQLEEEPDHVADLAVAKRLFGDYPYGRSAEGTTASLTKIDFADLILAKQRFLTADNATIAVSGNIKYDYVLKAIRQLYGGWEKATKKIPSTFAQPPAPDEKLQIINSTNFDAANELRFAFIGLSRNHKDFVASKVVTEVMNNRLRSETPQEIQKQVSVRQNSNLMPGSTVVGLSNFIKDIDSQIGEKSQMTHMLSVRNENLATGILTLKISNEEFQKAKTSVLAEMNQKNILDYWLDLDTFKIVSAREEAQKANDMTLMDVQRVADYLQKQPAAKIWLVKKSEKTN